MLTHQAVMNKKQPTATATVIATLGAPGPPTNIVKQGGGPFDKEPEGAENVYALGKFA